MSTALRNRLDRLSGGRDEDRIEGFRIRVLSPSDESREYMLAVGGEPYLLAKQVEREEPQPGGLIPMDVWQRYASK